MKKFLLTLLCAAATMAGSAKEVYFDFESPTQSIYGLEYKPNSYSDPKTISITDANQQVVKVNFTGGVRLWSDGLRFYKGSTLEVVAPENYVVTKVELGGASTQFSAPENEGNVNNNEWTGSQSSIKLSYKLTSGNVAVTSLKITYEEDSYLPANLAFAEASVSAELGKDFTAPELTKDTDGTPTYTSSNPDAATVDAETGAVTLVGAGVTTITATVAKTETHNAGYAIYTLKVIDPNAPKVWEKITSISEISADYDYIVVSQGSYTVSGKKTDYTHTMSSTTTTKNNATFFDCSDVTIDDNGTISSIAEAAAVITITKENGKYVFSIPSTSQYITTTAKNNATLGDSETAFDVVFENGYALITTTVEDSNKDVTVYLASNPGSSRFAFYATKPTTTGNQKSIMLYRKAKELVAAPVETPKGSIDGDEVEHDGSFELKGSPKVLKFELPEGTNLWYKFESTSKDNTTETEENSGIEALAEHTPEEGFVKYDHSKGIELKEVGTLTYYAEKDGVTGDKHILTVSGDATAIAEVEAESGVAEWYDLSGRKVAAPGKGVYVRKQGSKVAKIAL